MQITWLDFSLGLDVLTFIEQNVEIILPVVILILSFCLKLFVSGDSNIPNFISVGLEFPLDIIILALTFAGAFTISNPDMAIAGLIFCLITVVIAFFVANLRKSCRKKFESDKKWWITLGILNYILSGSALFVAVVLLNGVLLAPAKKINGIEYPEHEITRDSVEHAEIELIKTPKSQ